MGRYILIYKHTNRIVSLTLDDSCFTNGREMKLSMPSPMKKLNENKYGNVGYLSSKFYVKI